MSEIDTAPVDAPELGQADTPEGAPTDTAAKGVAPEAETFDWTPYGDQVVTVKVNGEDRRVPVKQAMTEHMLHADYTRKTQEIAAERQRLSEAEALMSAYERNPQATLEYLARIAEVQLGPNVNAAPEPEFLSPEEQALKDLQAQTAQLSDWQRQQMVAQELEALKGQFGDIDERAVLQHAVDIGAKSLDVAYRDMKFQELHDAEAQRKAASDAAEAAALEAKRGAGVISGGHSPATGSTQPSTSQPSTLRDAFAAARKQFPI